MITISFILPAYNEADNLETAVQSVDSAARSLGLVYEIIIVNDGSTDLTTEIARKLINGMHNLEFVEHYPNRGYGGALKAGFKAARYEWIAFLPADNQFNPLEIEHLLEQTTTADIIAGYRSDRRDPWIRKLNAWGWGLLVRLLFGYLSRDIDCGFKLFRKEILESVVLVSDGAMIDTELLAGAKARGYKICEVPLTHFPRRSGAATGANPAVILRAFRDLLRFRFRLWHEMQSKPKKSRVETVKIRR